MQRFEIHHWLKAPLLPKVLILMDASVINVGHSRMFWRLLRQKFLAHDFAFDYVSGWPDVIFLVISI